MSPGRRYAPPTETVFSFGRSQAHTHGLWPAVVQPYVTIVCRFNGLHLRNPCKYINLYLFTDPRGMESWVILVAWPKADSFPT